MQCAWVSVNPVVLSMNASRSHLSRRLKHHQLTLLSQLSTKIRQRALSSTLFPLFRTNNPTTSAPNQTLHVFRKVLRTHLFKISFKMYTDGYDFWKAPIVHCVIGALREYLWWRWFYVINWTARSVTKIASRRKATTLKFQATVCAFGNRRLYGQLRTVQWTQLGFRLMSTSALWSTSRGGTRVAYSILQRSQSPTVKLQEYTSRSTFSLTISGKLLVTTFY